MNREELEKAEQKFLKKRKLEFPHLFQSPRGVEDQNYLSQFGIYIPNKEKFPVGEIKTISSDFIVEEEGQNGQTFTINYKSPEEYPELKTTNFFATLVKCGVSTIEAVKDISAQLNIPEQNIGYAGIKDKYAITSQIISIKGATLNTTSKVNSPMYFLKDIYEGKGVIQKGQLNKNRFTILVRTNINDVNVPIFSEQVKKVFDEGYYNYYYLQRFGSPRYINFMWGSQIMAGKYKEAVESYLSLETPREISYINEIRRTIKDNMGDWKKILEITKDLPITLSHERKLADWLLRHPSDYLGALLTIPEQVTLWIYAVSSILFNDKISVALQKGEKVPENLPLLLSNDERDISLYSNELKALGLFPFRKEFIRSFRGIMFQKRIVSTKSRAELHGLEIVNEGIILSFSLNKGEYATTLLSHFFNLSFNSFENESVKIVDTKSSLNLEPITNVLEKFKNQITGNFKL